MILVAFVVGAALKGESGVSGEKAIRPCRRVGRMMLVRQFRICGDVPGKRGNSISQGTGRIVPPQIRGYPHCAWHYQWIPAPNVTGESHGLESHGLTSPGHSRPSFVIPASSFVIPAQAGIQPLLSRYRTDTLFIRATCREDLPPSLPHRLFEQTSPQISLTFQLPV